MREDNLKYLVKKFNKHNIDSIMFKKKGRLLTSNEIQNNIREIRRYFNYELQGSVKLLRLLAINYGVLVEVVSYIEDKKLIIHNRPNNGNLCNVVYKKL